MKHCKSVQFCQFLECQAPLHKRNPPIEDFLATVLTIFTSLCWVW